MNFKKMLDIPKERVNTYLKKENIQMQLMDIRETEYLLFFKMKKDSKKTYDIMVTNKDGDILCTIKWHSAWKKYTMKSIKAENDQIIFDAKCLQVVIEYINGLMLHRERVKQNE